ncbi:hypothetical protein ACP70R_036836 [Stipagrostis hirtigluma subsp. patula]
MDTPDENRVYTHCSSLDQKIVPFRRQKFSDEEAGYRFYLQYAEASGFGVSKGNSKKFSRTFNCNCTGKWEYYKPGETRQRNKTTKKTKCKAKIKLKKVYDDSGAIDHLYVDLLRLEHNHPLLPTPNATKQMVCHKNKDGTYMNYIDSLQQSGVPKHCVMNIMSEMHGGEDNIPITERDLDNSGKP